PVCCGDHGQRRPRSLAASLSPGANPIANLGVCRDGRNMVKSNLVPMSFLSPGPEPLRDARQSPAAADICRGVARLLRAHGMASLAEVPLANGRRADVVAIATGGEIWIAEIKSSVEDFRADGKWPEYREFCDRLFFAVAPTFPCEMLPLDTGLIVA